MMLGETILSFAFPLAMTSEQGQPFISPQIKQFKVIVHDPLISLIGQVRSSCTSSPQQI